MAKSLAFVAEKRVRLPESVRNGLIGLLSGGGTLSWMPRDGKSRSPLASRHVKMHARLFLQIADYAEKVPGLRVAARTEHAD